MGRKESNQTNEEDSCYSFICSVFLHSSTFRPICQSMSLEVTYICNCSADKERRKCTITIKRSTELVGHEERQHHCLGQKLFLQMCVNMKVKDRMLFELQYSKRCTFLACRSMKTQISLHVNPGIRAYAVRIKSMTLGPWLPIKHLARTQIRKHVCAG